MPKQHLTDQFIKALTPQSKRVEYYDDHFYMNGKLNKRGVDGFGLRLSPGGSKTFFLAYWREGTSKRITIGQYPTITLNYAREKATEYAQMVADGYDPNREKNNRKSDNPVTLSEYIDRFEREYVLRRNKLKTSTINDYKSRLRRLRREKSLSSKPITDITRADIRSFLKSVNDTQPYNANRLHSLLSKIFNEALNDGVVLNNPIERMEKLTKETPRAVEYDWKDIKKIWSAICDEEPRTQAFFKFLLINGQRKGETASAKWSDINFNKKEWFIPLGNTKSGKNNHIVPLTDISISVLKQMKALRAESEYVFPSPENPAKPITHIKRPTDRIRQKTNLPDFRAHDFRHIVATRMIEDCKVDFIHVGKVLNHKALAGENAITSRYVNTEYTTQKRNALERWSNKLTSEVSALSLAK